MYSKEGRGTTPDRRGAEGWGRGKTAVPMDFCLESLKFPSGLGLDAPGTAVPDS